MSRRTSRAIVVIAAALVGAVAAGCAASRPYYDPAFDARYRPTIRTVAILPFENQSSTVGADAAVQRVIEERLQALPASTLGVRLLTSRDVNPLLAVQASEGPASWRSALGADAVLRGVVRSYRGPSDDQRLLTYVLLPLTFLSAHHAAAEVVCHLQLVSCEDGALLWDYVALGTSQPYLGVGAMFTSVKDATHAAARRAVAAWPFRPSSR